MFKAKAILFLVKAVMWITVVGIGIWYISSSLDGASLTYSSVDKFLTAAGVTNGDISTANGCFLCGYVVKLFEFLSTAIETFWEKMLTGLWILLVIGFGIFLVISTIKHLWEATKTTSTLSTTEKKLEFKSWFDTIWKRGVRVMIIGILIGGLGMGGTAALKTISNLTIKPVMYLGSELSMAATGITSAAQCGGQNEESQEPKDILNPILKPSMCVIGNINTVMLAGAAGGFALMNYSWLGLGGGFMTWLAGLATVIMFLFVGFDLFFQILSVVFKLIFIIIFLPLFLAAAAFEGAWSAASGLVGKAIEMLVSSAVRMVAITLKVLIIYATVSYAADAFFPEPYDGYSSILPPLLDTQLENPKNETITVMNAFKECEQVGLANGSMNETDFANCFIAKKSSDPDAFDFLDNGWDFILMITCTFLLYFYAISPKVDKLLGKDGSELFDYGTWLKELGTKVWKYPVHITEKLTSKMGKS
jgi:hypothetical protein